MNKEYIKALERMGCATLEEDLSVRDIYENEYDIVKNALQRLESIDNANPSEALECLERLEYYHTRSVSDLGCKEHRLKDISTIKQALLKAEQDKKKAIAWDIVISKNVDMLLIKKYDNVSDYNSAVWLSGREKLTEEEFKIIKEVLEK